MSTFISHMKNMSNGVSLCRFRISLVKSIAETVFLLALLGCSTSLLASTTIPTIHTQLYHVTEVRVAEPIQSIHIGDFAGWNVQHSDLLPTRLYLKPIVASGETNLTISCAHHSYYARIQASNHAADLTVSLQPLVTNHPSSSVPPLSQIYWSYYYAGDTDMVPVNVFDDHHVTYFVFSPDQPIPVIYAVDHEDGRPTLVNLRFVHGMVLVESVHREFILMHNGYRVACIFRHESHDGVGK